MEKFLQTLSKPAKWVFIIGGFFYTAWFTIYTATNIGGGFISVVASLIIMTIGTALLVASPLLVLLKKDNPARLLFLFLLGYWVLSTIQSWLFYAETFVESNNGLGVAAAIFSFIAGLGIVAILVLTVLEFLLKKPVFRFISFLIFLGVVATGFIAGLLIVIYSGTNNAFWPLGANLLVEYMILPVVICFGYLYFMGSPAQKKE